MNNDDSDSSVGSSTVTTTPSHQTTVSSVSTIQRQNRSETLTCHEWEKWKTEGKTRYLLSTLLVMNRVDKTLTIEHATDAAVWNILYLESNGPLPSSSPTMEQRGLAVNWMVSLKKYMNNVLQQEFKNLYCRMANQERWDCIRPDGGHFQNFKDLCKRTKDAVSGEVSTVFIESSQFVELYNSYWYCFKKYWDFKYIITDAMITQVTEKVMREHNLKFRETSADETSKDFMERMGYYSVTRLRRNLMPKLKRNASREEDTNGKKKRRRRAMKTYNPSIHIKTEKIEDETMNQEANILNGELFVVSQQETSTLTVEEDIVPAMEKFLDKYFEAGGRNISSTSDFRDAWNDLREGQVLTEMAQESSSRGPTGQQLPPLMNGTPDEDSTGNSIAQETRQYQGEMDCGSCNYDYVTDESHNEDSLEKKYGPGMICSGHNCGLTLYQCLKVLSNPQRGAHVCRKCLNNECRMMKCNKCHYGEDVVVTRKSTRSMQRV